MDINDDFAPVGLLTIKELKNELDDIEGAIENEKIWANGSKDRAARRMHLSNIAWLRDRAREIEDELAKREMCYE
jgi:hypothetical protein